MNEVKYLLIGLAMLFLPLFAALVIKDYSEDRKAEEAMKLGYQQCAEIVDSKIIILYKKECK